MAKDNEGWQKRRERLTRERKGKERARRRIVRAIAIAAVMLVAVLAVYLVLANKGDEAGYMPAEPVGDGGSPTEVAIAVSDIGDSARFYTYDSGGTAVRFFAVASPDGTVHVAADACDVCYKSHKGYRQSGDSMQCNNCGKTFRIANIGTENTAGGCWPSYLALGNDGQNVLVAKSALDGKAYMFK